MAQDRVPDCSIEMEDCLESGRATVNRILIRSRSYPVSFESETVCNTAVIEHSHNPSEDPLKFQKLREKVIWP
jgi:hypothetical protein